MIDEKGMLKILQEAHKVNLVEPNYTRKYIPLGLAKIASFCKDYGTPVEYSRGYQFCNEDVVCITSLFTYDSKKVNETIEQILFLNPHATILLGGIYATLMPEHINKIYPNVHIFKGYSKTLDTHIPDYLIDWQIEEPWDTFSFVFTTRGCPNSCAYCAVKKTEPEIWTNPYWKEHIVDSKPNVMISDNNLSAQSMEHIEAVCNLVIQKKKHVVFDNGFDCKHITPEFASLLSKVKYTRNGLRLAFDRIEEDGIFQKAVTQLIEAGAKKSNIMAYVLFNFKDTPKEANYRMSECNRLGIRPYPQQFTPLNSLSRDDKFIGKYWTRGLLRAFRYFWLMPGIYTKHTFQEYIGKGLTIDGKFKLSSDDYLALELNV